MTEQFFTLHVREMHRADDPVGRIIPQALQGLFTGFGLEDRGNAVVMQRKADNLLLHGRGFDHQNNELGQADVRHGISRDPVAMNIQRLGHGCL